MLKFIAGLGCAILGVIIWAVGSLAAVGPSLESGNNSMFADPVAGTIAVIGFALMFLGPFLFWVILPIIGFIRGRAKRKPALGFAVPGATSSPGPFTPEFKPSARDRGDRT